MGTRPLRGNPERPQIQQCAHCSRPRRGAARVPDAPPSGSCALRAFRVSCALRAFRTTRAVTMVRNAGWPARFPGPWCYMLGKSESYGLTGKTRQLHTL